jgi:DNA-binding transcriptional LysR family regulator
VRSLNLDQLRTLVAVVETMSFSAAARRLNLTQPAVSVQIRELERRFGVKLIERLGRQAHATEPGRNLVEAAQRIFRECDTAFDSMRRYRDGWVGRVRIATTNTALMYLLPPVLRRLSLEHPGIELHVTNMPTRESIEATLDNRIDLALVTLPVDSARLLVTPLRLELMVAIFPAGIPGTPDVVTPQTALSHPLLLEHTRAAVHDLVVNWLAQHGEAPRVRMHLGTIEAVKRAVASNLGISIIPAMAVSSQESDITTRPLQPPIFRTLALIEHRSRPSEAAYDVVRNALLGLRDGSVAKPAPLSSITSIAPAQTKHAGKAQRHKAR